MEIIEGISDTWLLTIILILLIYYFSVSNYDFWRARGIPFQKPFPLFGNTINTFLGRTSLQEEQIAQYNAFPYAPYVGRFVLRTPILMIRDPDIVHSVLIEEFTSFYNRGINTDEKLDPLSQHLVNLRDKKWKNLRNKLTPVFSSGKLKTMHHQLVYLSESMATFIEKYTHGKPLDTREMMARFTTDVIGQCAFGIKMNALADDASDFRDIGRKIFTPSIKARVRTLIRQVAPKLLTILNWRGVSYEIEDFFVGVIREAIKSRENSKEEAKDFLQLLINLKKEDDQKIKEGLIKMDPSNQDAILDEMLMTANAFVFFLAGFETTASTLGFALFELGQNQHIQQKLREEVKSTLAKHNGEPTFEAIKEMKYLDQCINETLRKYPPVPTLPRECTRDYKLPYSNTVMKKGELLLIPVYSLHHDPKYYPKPDVFDPERFSDMTKIRKGTFLPFGDGPRICIGMRFARMEIKVLLATLLTKFEFHPHERTPSPLKFNPRSVLTATKGEIYLTVKSLAS